jgi:hypothetical protein
MDRVGYIYDPITGEEREISSEEIADAIVNAFLDDYSVYYTAEEYENKVSKGKGNYRGVGVQFYYSDTQVDVIVGNSPADQAGLVAGDIILSGKTENEEEKTKFNTATEIINYLKNCGENSEIFLEYERDGELYNATLKARPYVASYVNYFDSEVRDLDLWPYVGSGGHDDIENISLYHEGKILEAAVVKLYIHTTLPKENTSEFFDVLDISINRSDNMHVATIKVPPQEQDEGE